MKEIKFRAWQKNHKKIGRVKSISFNEKSEIEHLCFHNGDNCAPVYSNYWKNHKEWDLDNLELMQFTGLKDAKGVDIYEGDILEFMHHKHRVFRVKGGLFINSHYDDFDKDYTPFYEPCADMQTAQWMEQCTITGNIYEKPLRTNT